MSAKGNSLGIYPGNRLSRGFSLPAILERIRLWRITSMPRLIDQDQYTVVVVQRSQAPPLGEWEIYRNGKPLPIQFRDGDYQSRRTAETAGGIALREFLEALDQEQG
jgi:hypothetical protein